MSGGDDPGSCVQLQGRGGVTVAKPLHELTEKEFTSQAVGTRSSPGVARMYGFKTYHTLRSKGSEAGFPDWVLVRERVVYLELKRERGRLSPAQREWLRALLDGGAEAYVVRPRDLDALVNVLAHRSPTGYLAWEGQLWEPMPDAVRSALALLQATREECGA